MHCVRATATSALSPEAWRRSLDERLVDYERGRDLDGYVWGVKWQELYPGMKLVPDSADARRWSREVGLPFHEAIIWWSAPGLGPAGRRANWTGDDDPVRIEVYADARRGAVVLIVTEHELMLALFDRVPLTGVEKRLKLIKARRRGRPVTIAVPGKPAPAADPPPKPVHRGECHQADHQARQSHEEHEGHTRLTHRRARTFLHIPDKTGWLARSRARMVNSDRGMARRRLFGDGTGKEATRRDR